MRHHTIVTTTSGCRPRPSLFLKPVFHPPLEFQLCLAWALLEAASSSAENLNSWVNVYPISFQAMGGTSRGRQYQLESLLGGQSSRSRGIRNDPGTLRLAILQRSIPQKLGSREKEGMTSKRSRKEKNIQVPGTDGC